MPSNGSRPSRRVNGSVTPGRPARDDTAPAPSWRERFRALRHVPALLQLVWRTHRGYAAAVAVLRLVRAGFPVFTLWVGKLIIDAVVGAARTTGPARDAIAAHLWRLVALEVALVVAGDLLARGSSLLESLLADRFSNRTSVRLMEHAATLDLAQFEDPTFYDQLERARRQTAGRIGLFTQLLGMAQDSLTLASLVVTMAAFDWRLLLLLVAAILPSFLGETHFAGLSYSLLFRWTPERRQLDYLRYVGASDRTAKEVQSFGLAPWLVGRYQVLADRFDAENARLAVRRAGVGGALGLVSTAGYYAAYVLILARAVAGAISLGTLTFLAGAFARGRDLLQRLLSSASDVAEQALYLGDLFEFFAMQPTIASKPGAPPVPVPIREGFVFEDVGFRYPGSERWAVRGVDLTIRAGERIALVGENGAGKTTLTKLLARLYEPTEGRILLDGVDLRDYDLASLRATVGVIFQDFVRYDFAFDENVGVGEVAVLDAEDRRRASGDAGGQDADGDTPAPIKAAAERSLAASLLPKLPNGYRQMLGRRFEDGVDLSGGEWQKVALARAYLRDAQVLVLDEPTAALDARAEYEVFERFAELVAGRMAVLISHRFSTVRMADRIVVLGGGRVVEDGTHDELVEAGGEYAELFGLQAVGYR
ncbi:MAG: ABC transporter ATP-binding protein/permease [Candidatus Eremiobacteraeota bacterium]|nr:ABC transporter ATP-binding protein/permease [Candidatus Eremiobacteraeota bacterium]